MEEFPQLKNDDLELQLLSDCEFNAVRDSANRLLKKVFDKSARKPIDLHPENFWPDIVGKRPSPHLVLQPLDRVGSEPGFSGSRVLIGYFKDTKKRKSEILASRPLVVKIRKINQGKNKCELEDEKKRAESVKKFAKHYKNYFAWPLHFDCAISSNHSVLWSAFYSSTPEYNLSERSQLTLTQKGLYSVLAGDMAIGSRLDVYSDSNSFASHSEDPSKAISLAFEYLKNLHWHGKESPTVSKKGMYLVPQYRRYLRGFNIKGKWGDRWRQIWGPETQKTIRENSKRKHNPVRVLKGLESISHNVCVGAVHGDLHPRNIVFTLGGAPRVIDFGWAGREMHIAKDFVLMECNLRFMILRPDIRSSDLRALVNWIPFHNEFPGTKDKYLNKQTKFINILHEIAMTHYPTNTNWTIEYVVPLFLTALGLLNPKTLSSCHNRAAARLMVQNLADYLGNEIE